MTQEFWKAEEPAEIAQQYMQFHPELVGANIAFIFKEKASKRDGQPILGKASKVPARYKCLMEETSSGDIGYDFILEFGADAWADSSQETKAAWVDHCLELCFGEESKTSGDIVWKLRKPEIAAFPIIISRHGTQWDTGVNKLSTLRLREDEPILTEPVNRTKLLPIIEVGVSS